MVYTGSYDCQHEQIIKFMHFNLSTARLEMSLITIVK